ncbi:MAG: CDP-alcohol phosphatidyltransferase family protein [Phycisphaerales bacterium]|nr:CDP-alcohol phosphatidyltransferase family protein [Phycisphaerales bacterium]
MIEKPPTLPNHGLRHRRLVGISLLPAAMTLGNLLCGFLAILCCLLSLRAEFASEYFAIQPRMPLGRLEHAFPTHIVAGAYLLVLAMFFDALDGRLARLTRRTSEFGAQLDSVSDMVSFGIAPAALFVTILLRPARDMTPDVADATAMQVRLGLLAAAVYVSCAAIRLARFNAENVKSESSQRAFSGLPSPGAAALLIALIALHEQWRQIGFTLGGVSVPVVLRWLTTGVTFGVGLLMVSRFDYIHMFNVYIRRKQPPTHLVWLILILGLAWFSFELLLVVGATLYVVSGPLFALWQWRQVRAAPPT